MELPLREVEHVEVHSTIRYLKAGTDYGTYSAAQPDVAAKNMRFASVNSQQTCCEHAMNMF